MSNSRSKNAILNIAFGYAAQIGILILSFVGRRIFLKFLSVDYLGINGLYSNILTVLSLAELGLDAAVLYSLYKPVADNDIPLINSLLKYFKKIYIILALCIFMVGLALIPFLRFIIKSELNSTDLIIYYLLFLINTVASYFVAHKVAFLSACQEQRIQKIVTLSSNLILQILHIIVLLIWKNYYVYVSATVATTIINNLILNAICNKIHPHIKDKTELISFDKAPIKKRIYSTFVYKIGGVAINNTDNILISILVSTAAVGFYSNYYTLISAIQGFIAIVSTSLISGIGNLVAGGDKKRQYEIFNAALFFYHFVAALGFVGYSFLLNDVITVWLGEKYLFDSKTVFIIAFNFYITNAITPIWMYREANGLFEEVRYLMLIRAAINIVLSVVLGKLCGTFGILLATAISLMVTSLWYEPNILFKNVFRIPVSKYWIKQLTYFATTSLGFLISYLIVRHFSGGILQLVFKAIVVVMVVTIPFFAILYNSKELKKLTNFLKKGKIKCLCSKTKR